MAAFSEGRLVVLESHRGTTGAFVAPEGVLWAAG
jgi:hypothetical protein